MSYSDFQRSRTRVKICGLTRLQDVKAAIDAGVDAIGLVFYPPSPRAVTAEQAQLLVNMIPPYVQVVGLFVDPTPEYVQRITDLVQVDLLQFHGDEQPQTCQFIANQVAKRWYKALPVKPEMNLEQIILDYRQAGASAVLLDTWHAQLKGGTGACFDWRLFPAPSHPLRQQCSLVLAGGLTPDNVAQAIEQTKPDAVDVSGGVEFEKGLKDLSLILKFMQGVQHGSSIHSTG